MWRNIFELCSVLLFSRGQFWRESLAIKLVIASVTHLTIYFAAQEIYWAIKWAGMRRRKKHMWLYIVKCICKKNMLQNIIIEVYNFLRLLLGCVWIKYKKGTDLTELIPPNKRNETTGTMIEWVYEVCYLRIYILMPPARFLFYFYCSIKRDNMDTWLFNVNGFTELTAKRDQPKKGRAEE